MVPLIWLVKMTWRDGLRHFRATLLLLLPLTVGLSAYLSVIALRGSLAAAVSSQAKTLLGSDLTLASSDRRAIEKLADTLPYRRAFYVRFSSMLANPGTSEEQRSRLVQITAYEASFPFYGEPVCEPVTSCSFTGGNGVLLEKNLLQQLGLNFGDTVTLGGHPYVVIGTVSSMPGESIASAFALPRAYVSYAYLKEQGLLPQGSFARYALALQLPAQIRVQDLLHERGDEFEQARVRVDTVEKRERALGRVFDNIARFLAVASLVSLIIGATGSLAAGYRYAASKRQVFALLRLAGASAELALGVFILEVVALALCAVLAASVLALLWFHSFTLAVGQTYPALGDIDLSFPAFAVPAVITFLLAVSVFLLPFGDVQNTTPLELLRGDVPSVRRWTGFKAVSAIVLVISSLTAVQAAVTNARVFILAVTGLIIGSFLIAVLAAVVRSFAVRTLLARRAFSLRHAARNLSRPQNQTTVNIAVIATVSLSATILLTVGNSFDEELRRFSGHGQPNLVLFDIQPDQRSDVLELLSKHGLPIVTEAPVVTMRIVAIDGTAIERLESSATPLEDSARGPGPPPGRAPVQNSRSLPSPAPASALQGRPPQPESAPDNESSRRSWALEREYRSTYRDHLTDAESIVDGKWLNQSPRGAPVFISVEAGIAESLGVKVGSKITFDVQGRELDTIVGSLRKVDWKRFEPNFFVVFPPGSLEGAPQFGVIVTRTQTASAEALLQTELGARFPNISTVDLSFVLGLIAKFIQRIATLIKFAALFILGSALVVLVTTYLLAIRQRAVENTLLKVFGATSDHILRLTLMEYSVLGISGLTLGMSLGCVAAYALCHFAFDIPVVWPATAFFQTAVLLLALLLLTAVLQAKRIYRRPALHVLQS